jgi:hypothetical protein
LLLILWAVATAAVVPLPAIHAPAAGALLAVAGLLLMAAGMVALAVHGGGLPMNAYPPPRLVARGVYGWTGQPIYVGFIAAALGAALVAGSPSGVWLVVPVAALALAALVLGYERHDLRRRFGSSPRPRLALPGVATGPAEPVERAAVYLLVLLPSLIAYQAVHLLGVPRDAIAGHLPFERGWPVLEWTMAVHASGYFLVLATPLLVRSRPALRRFAVTGLLAMVAMTLLYLLVPLTAPPRPFEPVTALGRLLALEHSVSNTVATFPAFQVLWALIAAAAWGSRGAGWARAGHIWALLVALSSLTTGLHALVDVLAAYAIFPVLHHADRVWDGLRRGAERIANSWREWRIGPVRVLSHGIYTGVGGAAGAWIAGLAAGPEAVADVVGVAVFALLFSALWAQVVEGSPALLRPLGFYGGIVGGLLAVASLPLLGRDPMPVLLGIALAMPWVQAAGRVRCLVQGCCHGGPAPDRVGIRYRHSRSRVAQIAGLAGVPLHPTPLYSLLGNVVTGLLLVRLHVLGASVGLIVGIYFILNAVVRFVEESYRAEPQTPVVAGLRLYQWLAAGSFALGIGFTTLGRSPLATGGNPLDSLLLAGALLVGLAGWFVTGVDFPSSDRRFSRLAAVGTEPRLLAPGEELTALSGGGGPTREEPVLAVPPDRPTVP